MTGTCARKGQRPDAAIIFQGAEVFNGENGIGLREHFGVQAGIFPYQLAEGGTIGEAAFQLLLQGFPMGFRLKIRRQLKFFYFRVSRAEGQRVHNAQAV